MQVVYDKIAIDGCWTVADNIPTYHSVVDMYAS